MRSPITPEQFRDTHGLEDWQVGADAAWITFSTPDFSTGAGFVGEVAAIADELDHHPDVDLRYSSVLVRTSTHDTGGLSERDVALALKVTQAAKARGFDVAA